VLAPAEDNAFSERVEVACHGGEGLLASSLPSADLLDTATQLLRRERLTATRVLLVDDDPAIRGPKHPTHYESWGASATAGSAARDLAAAGMERYLLKQGDWGTMTRSGFTPEPVIPPASQTGPAA
jgi:hypothetical protein